MILCLINYKRSLIYFILSKHNSTPLYVPKLLFKPAVYIFFLRKEYGIKKNNKIIVFTFYFKFYIERK